MRDDKFSDGHWGKRAQDTTAVLCYSRPTVRRLTALLAALILSGCNMPRSTPTPTPMAAIIRGVVWHDQCAGDAPESDAGCARQASGRYVADGDRQAAEPGIAGVRVELGEGSCPATGLQTTLTATDGSYAFIGHPAGSYCVSVDANHSQNRGILMPGEWSTPAQVTLTVTGGDDRSDIDFGWDYEQLPLAEPPQATETIEPTLVPNQVTATVNANCRSGPGTVYDVVGFLLEGDAATVQARDPEAEWWQVRLTDSGVLCWISSLTVQGEIDTAQLPIATAPPTPTPSPGSIAGRVWHDTCAVSGGEGGEPAVPSPGCVALEGGGFAANGLMEQGEPGLSGVLVNLGSGACPSIGLNATVTGDDGEYQFSGLEGGTYCISVDALGAINSTILIPGGWTQPPADGLAATTIILEAGEEMADVNFGWDYQFQ